MTNLKQTNDDYKSSYHIYSEIKKPKRPKKTKNVYTKIQYIVYDSVGSWSTNKFMWGKLVFFYHLFRISLTRHLCFVNCVMRWAGNNFLWNLLKIVLLNESRYRKLALTLANILYLAFTIFHSRSCLHLNADLSFM